MGKRMCPKWATKKRKCKRCKTNLKIVDKLPPKSKSDRRQGHRKKGVKPTKAIINT